MTRENGIITLLKNRIKVHQEVLEDKQMFETFDLKRIEKAQATKDKQALVNAATNMMANKDEYLLHQGAILELNELISIVEKTLENINANTNPTNTGTID